MPLERPEEPEVVVRRELLVERQLLRHETEAPLRRIGVPGEDGPGDPHLPRVGGQETADDRDRRRLPGPVRPEEADDRPLLDAERDAVDGGNAVVGLAKTGDLEGGGHERARGDEVHGLWIRERRGDVSARLPHPTPPGAPAEARFLRADP